MMVSKHGKQDIFRKKPHDSTKDATGMCFCIYIYIHDTERLHCEMQKVTGPLKTTGGRGGEEEEEGRGNKVMTVCTSDRCRIVVAKKKVIG